MRYGINFQNITYWMIALVIISGIVMAVSIIASGDKEEESEDDKAITLTVFRWSARSFIFCVLCGIASSAVIFESC